MPRTGRRADRADRAGRARRLTDRARPYTGQLRARPRSRACPLAVRAAARRSPAVAAPLGEPGGHARRNGPRPPLEHHDRTRPVTPWEAVSVWTRTAPARQTKAVATRAELSRRGRAMYGLPVTPTWRTANYAHPRGVGADRGVRPSYPIDPRHVRAALSRSAQRNTASSPAAIRSALRRRYGSVDAALAAARRAQPSRSTASRSTTRRSTTRRSTARSRR